MSASAAVDDFQEVAFPDESEEKSPSVSQKRATFTTKIVSEPLSEDDGGASIGIVGIGGVVASDTDAYRDFIEMRTLLPRFEILPMSHVGQLAEEAADHYFRNIPLKSYEVSFTQEEYNEMALQNPLLLIRLVQSDFLRPSNLTFALEAVGNFRDSGIVRRLLLPHLNDPSALVREGAIYGLTNHLDEPTRKKLVEISQGDESSGVRAAAEESLEG